jgi:hypothetical protein
MSISRRESPKSDVALPGNRPRLPPIARARLSLATLAGRMAATASRVAGRGSGASIRGKVMLGLDPDA